jgi:predicted small secreted protein
MKKLMAIALLVVVTASLGACSNTLDGAGRDISKAGDKISETF